jgi:hypothetical protein
MSDHVQDGVLLKTSPTDMEAHDPTTVFGCSRRWWYKRVMGLPEPATPSQELGTAFHAAVESMLDPARKRPTMTPQLTAMVNSAKWAIEEVRPRVLRIEEQCKLSLEGVVINGRVDVLTRTGILDWKTSSNPKRYAKGPADLRRSLQMGLYGLWARSQGVRVSSLEHVTVPTKQPGETLHTSALVTPADLDAVETKAILQLRSMKETARAKRAADVAPDRDKCRMCPFVDQCPKGDKNIMALLSLFQKPSTPAPETPAPVLPPEAPPRHLPMVDVKEAEPTAPPAPPAAETFEPVPPPKRARGRPPGSKNKPQPSTPLPPPSATPPVPPPVKTVDATFKIKTIRVNHGLTVPIGGPKSFSSVRVDVSMEADSDGDESAVLAVLHAKVKAEVAREAATYLKGAEPDAAK